MDRLPAGHKPAHIRRLPTADELRSLPRLVGHWCPECGARASYCEIGWPASAHTHRCACGFAWWHTPEDIYDDTEGLLTHLRRTGKVAADDNGGPTFTPAADSD